MRVRERVGTPRWVLIPAGAAAAFIALPVVAMLSRLQPGQLWPLLSSPSARAALRLSLETAAASTALCLLLGVPLALALARFDLPGARVLRSIVLLPLVLPPVVGGIALLALFGRTGWVGSVVETAGGAIAFTPVAVVLAQTFVSLPFLVVGVEGALRSAGEEYEELAATLGASPTAVLGTITLPVILPGLVSGTILAFARSLGEFGATLTFAGSLEGVTRTLPLQIYLQRETDPAGAIALSAVLVAVALVVVGISYPGVLRRAAREQGRP